MELTASYKSLADVIPVMGVKDDMILSRRGEVTIGWEMTLPSVYSITEGEYDAIVNGFAAAAKILPAWTMIHRQDIFLYDRFKGVYGKGYLSDCFNRHFEGRRFLCHRQYLFLTLSSKASALRSISQGALFGFRFNSPRPSDDALRAFDMKAEEFISIVTGSGYLKARRLTHEEIEGVDNEPGLIQRYMMLGGDTPLCSDIVLNGSGVQVFDKELIGYKISESEYLPGEVSNVSRVTNLEFPASGSKMYLSLGSALGVRLDCEHVVNQYILIPSQDYVLQELDKKRKKMTSMSNQAENRVNAEQITKYIDDVHKESKTCCYAHMNVLLWGSRDEIQDLKGKASTAFSSMGVVATQSLYDLPALFLAGVPGGACEVCKENLMTQELLSMLCMGVNESYDRPVENGLFTVVDRFRNVPVTIDLQMLARSLGLIDNYNVFLLGPSGSGKSFFVNFLLRQCYENGENDFVIDIGGSYQGICQIINECSGGKDGIYLSWDIDHPFSFNPFIGYLEWIDAGGSLCQDNSGLTFFFSFLTTAWNPAGGWTSDMMSVLELIVLLFVQKMRVEKAGELPIFDDFYRFLGNDILPRIIPEYDEKGNIRQLPKNPLLVAYNAVTPADFDIAKFMRALLPYSLEGGYSFLLNEKNPKDLFSSRFTVFEVDKLSKGNPLFYSICVLCIINAFDQKMQNTSGFKRIVIDEAWKAIANETMAPYLRGLWKVSRKYQTSAMVVTQELDDILSSDVIKEAILQNSDTKVLLNQMKNANRFDELSALLGLGEHQKNMILSMGLAHDPKYFYTDCYIGMNNRYGIYSIEVSPEEALAFESDKIKKQPLLDRASELGSILAAIEERVRMRKMK